ncbi:uncharacterized protein LOC119164688 [Rhipicephalus microplus]|uniref:uncharacterized protein LOC119164688 n=1 Tax=Rhipicephalus microplus TaxID=6941 RepID=UPI003F6C24C4
MLNKTIHKAVKEMGEAEVQRRLDTKYLPVTPTDPLPSYERATNERLDADMVLQTINCKSASGPDHVTNKALRNLNDTAIEALTKYYNQCWRTGKLPQQWKTAKTVLIPKPGKPPSIDNLRPISLTSCVCKVLEHVLLNRWQRYLEESNIYPHTMLGFRAELCTQDAMLLLKNEIVDRHFPTLNNRAVLRLDLQGAFDNVHHSAVLRQVSHLNMGERTFAYIKDFLTNHIMRLVALHEDRNALVRNIKYTISADDITLWSTRGSDSQIEAALQEAVAAVEERLRPTGLKCSPTKSEMLVISPRSARRQSTQNITVVTQDGTPIPHVQTLIVLGLHLEDLNRNHVTVQMLHAKLSLATRLLKKVATRYQGMREDSLLRLTQLFAVSHISYVASFHNWKAAEKIKIDAMIRKAYKTALGLYPHTNT